MTATQSMPRRKRVVRGALCAVLFLVAVGAGIAAVVVLPRWGALQCMLQSLEPLPDLGTPPAGVQVVEADEALGFERALIARPQGDGGKRNVIVFVPGIIDEHGIESPRVTQAADSFTKAGHIVFVPEIVMFTDPGRDSDDLITLLAAIRKVADGEIAGSRKNAFGIVGISLGGALALRALAQFREEGGRGCRAALTIGAPGSLHAEAQSWFEQPLPADDLPEGAKRSGLEAAAFARNVLYRAALPTLIQDAKDRRVLKDWLDKEWMPKTGPIDKLTTDVARQHVSSFLGGVQTWKRDRARILQGSWGRLRHSSPFTWRQRFQDLEGVTIFLLHGIHDPLISIASLGHLQMFLSRATMTTALRSNLITHAGVTEVGLGEKLRHVAFLDDFFDMVGG